jgi:pimeloyl-ACP methyl ester carboxylesterase
MTVAPGVERSTVEVDGCTLSYMRAGKGEPLLFLHAAGGVMGWTPWMARLAERYDLIVPDHPGFGATEMPEWLDNIHDLGYFYLDAIAALGLSKINLAGHSLGGWIACELAVRSTATLKTLTLIAPAGLRVKGVQKYDPFITPPDTVTRTLFVDQKYADALLMAPLTEEQMDMQLKNRFTFARLAWQPRLYDPHLAKWLHRIDVPTLIVWGDSDRMVPPAYADEFRRLIPGSKVEIITKAGHVPQVEQNEAFMAALTGFLG